VSFSDFRRKRRTPRDRVGEFFRQEKYL
jgi:hypothetical protein